MAIPHSLGGELFRYRRRKRASLDGSVPGLPQEHFHKSRRPVSGTPYVPKQRGYHHDLYNWGLPGEYHPNVNAPSVQMDEYDPEWESHRIAHQHEERLFGPLREPELGEAPFDYEHSKVMTDLFLKAMDLQYQPLEDGQEVPSLADLWQAHLSGDVNPLPELLDDINGIEHVPGEVAPEERLPQGLPDRGAARSIRDSPADL